MRRDRRHCQPFAVPNRGTAISVDALSLMLGGSCDRALAFIPAFDFQPRRLGVGTGYGINVAKEGTQDHGESNPQTRGTANV